MSNLLDAGFIYTGPHFSKHGWTPVPGKCRATCSESFGNSTHFWQCTRAIKVEREVLYHGQPATFGYCGQHDPVKVKERRDKREAGWRQKWDAQDRAARESARMAALRADALDAIKAIARGHNDPRTLALETLAKHGEKP